MKNCNSPRSNAQAIVIPAELAEELEQATGNAGLDFVERESDSTWVVLHWLSPLADHNDFLRLANGAEEQMSVVTVRVATKPVSIGRANARTM